MKISQDIKVLFDQLPLQSQRELLEHLLLEQELQDKVLQEAGQAINNKGRNFSNASIK